MVSILPNCSNPDVWKNPLGHILEHRIQEGIQRRVDFLEKRRKRIRNFKNTCFYWFTFSSSKRTTWILKNV